LGYLPFFTDFFAFFVYLFISNRKIEKRVKKIAENI